MALIYGLAMSLPIHLLAGLRVGTEVCMMVTVMLYVKIGMFLDYIRSSAESTVECTVLYGIGGFLCYLLYGFWRDNRDK